MKRKFPHALDHEIRVKVKKWKEPKALRRLMALNMYRQGMSNKVIGEATGYHPQRITELVTEVLQNGLESILKDGRKSNNYRMTFAQEADFLKQFEDMAEDGQLVTVAPILQKYEEATGKKSNTTAIYRLLKRHGWRKLRPRSKHPKAASAREQLHQKRLIQAIVASCRHSANGKKVMLAFQDEAGFGRILDAASCWAPPRERPTVPNERHREYRTVYGIVIPQTGEHFFEVYDHNNTETFEDFLKKVSEKFPDYCLVLCCDQAGWHTSPNLKVPENICLFFILPHTPEMNPIEQIWKEIRKRGFKNVMFKSLDDLFKTFWEVVSSLETETVISITARDWIRQAF